MVRRHGWQLPVHTFQVVAITVFFLLTIAYYVFFAPFLGSKALEYVAIAVYTPVALGVFLLYIRCTGIDPSDPGILAGDSITNQDKHSLALNSVVASVGRTPQSSNAWSSSVIQSDKESNNKVVGVEEGRNGLEIRGQRTSCLSYLGLGCFLCDLLVKEDSCRGNEDHQQPTTDEDILFCTLCNTEVQKYSKHCRSCDKCVDKFDHHCRWLNNCVGRKNYVSFVALMALGLMLLLLDCGVGIAVFVRCFVDKKGTERQIIENLGNSFSRVPFATVVAVCSVVSLLSSIPLGELFFFHIILIRKGITTYEYVVAMRAQGDLQGTAEGDERSLPSSPTSSTATGLSGSSSLGLQYRGAWCTPPRVFVEYQDEVMPHLGPGMVPSTIDPDASSVGGGSGSGPKPDISGRSRKRAVRISAWKLAKLNPGDAARAAAKARENSSVLRPLGMRDGALSGNASSRSSMSTDRGYPMVGSTRSRRGDLVFSPNMAGRAIIGRDGGDRGGGGPSQSSYYSSPAGGSSVYNPSASMSPLSGPPVVAPRHPPSLPFPYVGSSSYAHRGHLYEASSNESVDTSVALSDRNGGGGGEEEESNKRSSVLWDERAGKFVSVSIPSPHNSLPSFLNPFRKPKPQTEILQAPTSTLSSILPLAKIPSVSGSTSEAPPLPHAPPSGEGNLVYSETSIFFGGPLNVPMGSTVRKEEESSPPPKKTSVGASAAFERKEIRLPRGSAVARSQSPVFAPRSALPPLVSNNASTAFPLPKPSRQ